MGCLLRNKHLQIVMVVQKCLLSVISSGYLVDLDAECANLFGLEALLGGLVSHEVLNLYPKQQSYRKQEES